MPDSRPMGQTETSRPNEYQYRLRADGLLPTDWEHAWEDDRSIVEEEVEVARAIGIPGARVETRLRPQPDCCGTDWELTW